MKHRSPDLVGGGGTAVSVAGDPGSGHMGLTKSWQMRLVGSTPLRRFFWTPTGLLANPGTELAVQEAGAATGVMRFQTLRPGGEYACFCAELAMAKVIGDVTLVATAGDAVLGGLQGLHGATDPAGHWVLKRCRFRIPRKLPGRAVLLAATSGSNYFHWLFESLPRLRLLELAGFDLKTVDWFLINELCQKFHDDSLDEMGVPASKRFRCSKQRLLRTERLVVVSPPAQPGVCPAWVCDFLKDKFLRKPGARRDRKIYVSRRQARGRRLMGEEQLLPWLEQRGFEVVCLEQTSFREQVDLFASTRIMVGVHGAAMANLVFMPAGATVMEFLPPQYPQDCYRKLAATLGLNYRLVVGNSVPQRIKDSTIADVFLDPEEFKREVMAVDG